MKHLRPLVYGLSVAPIITELEAHPELWNQHTVRTTFEYSPHKVDDIWIRYRQWEDLQVLLRKHGSIAWPDTEAAKLHADQEAIRDFVGQEHDSVWYPAIYVLPALRALIFQLMHAYEVERLGGVLITRIPPGGDVRPHVDRGWHAGYYEKIAVQLKSAPGQRFCFADGGFECPPGTAYAFDNSFEHWVENPTACERITCIVCVRRDPLKTPLYSGTGE